MNKRIMKKRTFELTIAGYTFSLKNLKVHDDMSEETICFSADLVCDGKVIGHCKNDGRGTMTDVCCYPSDPEYDLYSKAMQVISTIHDIEYEKKMNERMKQYKEYDGTPYVQCYSADYLVDQLVEKQLDRDDLISQLIAFAKKYPLSHIWIKDNIMKAVDASKDAAMLAQGYENVTEWVR